MQVKCIRAHGTAVPGDLAEVPDGASVDSYHWEPVAPVTVAIRADGADEALAKLGELTAKASELTPATPAKEKM